MPIFERALVSLPGKERIVHPSGGPIIIHTTGSETNDAIGIFEGIIAPRAGVDLHWHKREDETFRVIAGEFRFWCGEEIIEGGPGTTIVAPRGVPHRWLSLGDAEARLLCMVTPGGFERFFQDMDVSGPVSAEAFAETCDRYGLVFGERPYGRDP